MKGGQFFLVAAIVIILILIGLASIYTFVNTSKEDVTFQGLSDELNYESAQVIDNGIFNNLNQEQINQNIRNLTSFYALSNPESDLIFLYGNKKEVTILIYNNSELGNIGISSGGTSALEPVSTRRTFITETFEPDSDEVSISLKDGTYYFQIREGQNFYIIIKKQRGDEHIVATKQA